MQEGRGGTQGVLSLIDRYVFALPETFLIRGHVSINRLIQVNVLTYFNVPDINFMICGFAAYEDKPTLCDRLRFLRKASLLNGYI